MSGTLGRWCAVAEITRAKLNEIFLDDVAAAFDDGELIYANKLASILDPRDGQMWTLGQMLDLLRLGKDAKGVLRG